MNARDWHTSYDPGVPTEIEFDRTPLSEWPARSAELHPDHTALVFFNARWSFAELHDEIERMAAALRSLGVEKGTRVAIQMPNIPQLVIAYYATLRLGGVVVLTNPLYMGYEIEHQWNDAGCEVALVMDFLYEQKLAPIRDKLPIRHYITASIPEYLRFPLRQLAPFRLKRKDPPAIASVEESGTVHHFRTFLRSHEPLGAEFDADVTWGDLAVLQYTGGTTGVSKGAMLSHANLGSNCQQNTAWFGDIEPATEVVIAALPLFHVFGMTVAMNWGMLTASTLVLQTDPRDIEALARNISRHEVTLLPAVPAMFNALNNLPGIDKQGFSTLKRCFSGSAPLPPEVLQRFEGLTGATVLEGFGMSETSPVTHINPMYGTRKIGSIGLPVTGTDVRIVSVESGEDIDSHGVEGELVVRGPQVMQGYWNQPEETDQVLRDGWLHTGDLASRDEAGYFTIRGRTKDMINASGYKVYPDEVDRVLMSHDDILESATIGVPHPRRGETVKSFIVPREGVMLEAEQIKAWIRELLASYKVPREIEFLDELPKSAVLKVLRRELRERELARLKELERA